MRPAVPLTITLGILLALHLTLMVPLAGCQENVTNPWVTPTPSPSPVPPVRTPLVPPTEDPFPEVITPGPVSPPPVTSGPTPRVTPTLTLVAEKNLYYVYNETTFRRTLVTPPLVIQYTLTVPNVSKTGIEVDPVTGKDRTVQISYPDPAAEFEVTVTNMDTGQVEKEGYGGQYDVTTSKKIWVRSPGNYYINFRGRGGVRAHVEFYEPPKT